HVQRCCRNEEKKLEANLQKAQNLAAASKEVLTKVEKVIERCEYSCLVSIKLKPNSVTKVPIISNFSTETGQRVRYHVMKLSPQLDDRNIELLFPNIKTDNTKFIHLLNPSNNDVDVLKGSIICSSIQSFNKEPLEIYDPILNSPLLKAISVTGGDLSKAERLLLARVRERHDSVKRHFRSGKCLQRRRKPKHLRQRTCL